MPKKIRPKYGIDPVQAVPSFSFNEDEVERLLNALVELDRNSIIERLAQIARKVCFGHGLGGCAHHHYAPLASKWQSAVFMCPAAFPCLTDMRLNSMNRNRGIPVAAHGLAPPQGRLPDAAWPELHILNAAAQT